MTDGSGFPGLRGGAMPRRPMPRPSARAIRRENATAWLHAASALQTVSFQN